MCGETSARLSDGLTVFLAVEIMLAGSVDATPDGGAFLQVRKLSRIPGRSQKQPDAVRLFIRGEVSRFDTLRSLPSPSMKPACRVVRKQGEFHRRDRMRTISGTASARPARCSPDVRVWSYGNPIVAALGVRMTTDRSQIVGPFSKSRRAPDSQADVQFEGRRHAVGVAPQRPGTDRQRPAAYRF